MRKTTILMFWVAGLIFALIGGVMIVQIPRGELLAPVSSQSPALIPIALLFISSVASFIAWVGALIAAIRYSAWGWLIALIFLGSLGMLAFLIFGPDEYSVEGDYDGIGDYGDFNDLPA
jgi:hypothetical protein